MHYIIDGYNLLFRLLHKGQEVRQARESMIAELSQKAEISELNLILVFDSKYQEGTAASRREGTLVVVYTNEGETADEWIIRESKRPDRNSEEKVVTSDKRLAVHIRVKGIQTISCEDFIAYLNKRCKAYLLGQRKKNDTPTAEPEIEVKPKKVAKGSAEYYEAIFEKKLAEEPAKKIKKTSDVLVKKKVKKPKPEERTPESELDRWTRLFGG